MNALEMILGLAMGLVLFLYGMDLMGDSLKKLAGGKMESILAKLSSLMTCSILQHTPNYNLTFRRSCSHFRYPGGKSGAGCVAG